MNRYVVNAWRPRVAQDLVAMEFYSCVSSPVHANLLRMT